MQLSNVKARFHIFTGYREESVLVNSQQAGESYEIESEDRSYYIVKMWAFPREAYYLSSNREGGRYTLFAKMTGDEVSPSFRRPVGFGIISSDLKNHLEIQFTFPRQRVFMSLFPDKITIDSLIGVNGGVSA